MKRQEKYIEFIKGLATPLDTRYRRRYAAKQTMFNPNTSVWIGQFKATLSALLNCDNYILTVEENKYTGKSKLFIREIEMRLVGVARLPGLRQSDFFNYTCFWMDYWMPEKWQSRILAPEDYGISKVPDIELLTEYNRRHPINRKRPEKPTAEIIDFQKYLNQPNIENAAVVIRK